MAKTRHDYKDDAERSALLDQAKTEGKYVLQDVIRNVRSGFTEPVTRVDQKSGEIIVDKLPEPVITKEKFLIISDEPPTRPETLADLIDAARDDGERWQVVRQLLSQVQTGREVPA